ncbi:MAG: BspA family leucine-rich repeat surface protein [Spirochaetota bacterium]
MKTLPIRSTRKILVICLSAFLLTACPLGLLELEVARTASQKCTDIAAQRSRFARKYPEFEPENRTALKALLDKSPQEVKEILEKIKTESYWIIAETDFYNWIDTGKVRDMSELFKNKPRFNANISCWDTSNVKNMRSMFEGAGAFDQDIHLWQTAKVTDMEKMFAGAAAFTQDLSSWTGADKGGKVREVRAWGEAFKGSGLEGKAAKQPAWRRDFQSCGPTLRTHRPESKAKLQAAIQAVYTGYNTNGTTNANADLNVIDTREVKDMSSLFNGKTHFNGSLLCWDVSNVSGETTNSGGTTLSRKGMGTMFAGATSFNQDIGHWDVSQVLNMRGMFDGATAFNNESKDSIQNWDTSRVKVMSLMFHNASAFNRPLGTWKISGVVRVAKMFHSASIFDQNLSGWRMNKDILSSTKGATVFQGSAMAAKKNWWPKTHDGQLWE